MKTTQKKTVVWGDVLVVLAVLLFAAAVTLTLPAQNGQKLEVRVTVDGQVVLERQLSDLVEPIRFTVDEPHPLVLEIFADGVRVVETACPGEDCLHMGTISQAGEQIVCLPNRLVVTLKGNTSSFDAVVG